MKKLGSILFALLAVTNAWCARKITVSQLEDLLRSMQQDKKSDIEIATALKQIELSEELTRSKMNGLVSYVPGALSTEQIYVLEARSADLAPPQSDLPATPVPDAAAQSAILAKAAAYISATYSQLPAMAATKTTLRFQDNVEALAAASGLQNGAQDVSVGAGFSNPASFVHYINSSQAQVVTIHGAEQPPAQKDTTPWGANKMIAVESPDPGLADVFKEAQSAESIRWLRWESVSGRPMAVFAFAVPRKKSHLDVVVCCFPKINQTGVATFYTATTAAALGGGSSGQGGVTGNFQTSTNWREYKTTAPYHGELFIDPETGTVARMIAQDELKSSDVVHEVDTRIDFGPINLGGKIFVVPVKTYIDTLVVPNGDSGAATYTTRRTLFTSEYKDYQLTVAK
jgi:hypothetical protein